MLLVAPVGTAVVAAGVGTTSFTVDAVEDTVIGGFAAGKVKEAAKGLALGAGAGAAGFVVGLVSAEKLANGLDAAGVALAPVSPEKAAKGLLDVDFAVTAGVLSDAPPMDRLYDVNEIVSDER